MKKNRLIAILMAAAITLTYMPAMAYGGSEELPQNEETIVEEAPDAGGTDIETADPAYLEEPSDSLAVQPEEEAPADIPDDTADETEAPDKASTAETTALERNSYFTLSTQSDSEWGPWSAWQDGAISESATRQVETRQVIDSYSMSSYVFTDSSSPNKRGYAPYSAYGTLRAHYEETWPKAWVDSARWVLGAGSYYDSPDNDNCDGLIHDGTAYVVVHGQGHDYVPFFITGTNYKTQYRYRDTNLKTPECNKTSPKITTATITWKQPSGNITGYEIQYSTSSQFNNCKSIRVKGSSNCSCRLTGLKAGTVYYIRIRVYVVVNGKTVYRKWGSTCRMKTCSKEGNLTSVKWSGVKNCTCTGKPVKRTFTIIRNGVKLIEGTDYTVAYKNNTRVGTATIIVKGCGKYFGTITRTFRILPKGTTLSKCTGKSKAVSVKWNKRSSNCSGYQVRYCTRSDFKDCKYKTVKGKNTISCTIDGLKPFTKYFIEVRIYYVVGGKNYYSAWSKFVATSTEGDGSSYRSMPVEYTIKYPSNDGDYFDGVKSVDIKLTYNKYGLVDEMTRVTNSVGGRHKDVSQFRYTFYDNKSIKTMKERYIMIYDNKSTRDVYTTVSMNKNGAITTADVGRWDSFKGKASYYDGTNRLKRLDLIRTKGGDYRERHYFDEAGYWTGYANARNTYLRIRKINSKGLCTSEERVGHQKVKDYRYTIRNGNVATRRDYWIDDDGNKKKLKTVIVTKRKKIRINENSLRSARYTRIITCLAFDEGDEDTMHPTFVYEWK